jgi:ABC-2 type transport system permease protein
MVIGLAVRTNPYMPLMAILWVSLFLSGTFNKDTSIDGLTEHMPARLIQDAAFDLTVFGRDGKLLSVVAVCAVVSAVAAAVGAMLLSRKKVVS